MIGGRIDADGDSGLPPRVDQETLSIYRRVLELEPLDTATLEEKFGPGEARRVMQKLSAVQLAHVDPETGHMAVLRPDVVASAMIHPLEEGIRATQRRIGRISGEFDRLMAVYRSAMNDRNRQDGLLDVVTNPGFAEGLVRDRIARARKEVLVMCGRGPRSGPNLEPILSATGTPAREGVRVCVLYQHAVRYQADAQDRAAIVAAAGGRVRTIDKLWSRICLVDQEILFVFDETGVVSVRQPAVAAAAAALFEQAWSHGKPFDGEPLSRSEGRELQADVRRAIIYFLIEGMRDEAIARRVGVSVRTCRRHIAELLEQMGAESRFQAGYLTAKLGLLEQSS